MQLPPVTILNQIGRMAKIKNRSMKTLFQMSQPEVDRLLDGQAKDLQAAGHDPVAVAAYLALEPLRLENEAISKFVEKMGDSSLRAVLPEILTKQELVRIADLEMMLTPAQKKGLMALLR
jgi:hypothetical protein